METNLIPDQCRRAVLTKAKVLQPGAWLIQTLSQSVSREEGKHVALPLRDIIAVAILIYCLAGGIFFLPPYKLSRFCFPPFYLFLYFLQENALPASP